MGILTRGILGPMINTTGAVIGKISRGQNVITGLREDTARISSESQVEQQYRFKLLLDFFGSIPDLVDAGFKNRKRHQSAANAANHYNYDHAFLSSDTSISTETLSLAQKIKLNCPALVYSTGPVNGPNCGTAVRNNDATCTFSWLNYPQSRNNQLIDRAGFVIWNASKNKAYYDGDVVPRSALQFTVNIPAKAKNDELHFYMHFHNRESRAVGRSSYLGSTVQ